MTIIEAIEHADGMRANKLSNDTKIRWLNELDGMVWTEIITTHERGENDTRTFDGYDGDTDIGTVLLVPEPYTDVYLYWLMSRIDLANGEPGKYNNDKTLFNSAYNTYGDYVTRHYSPVRKAQQFRL